MRINRSILAIICGVYVLSCSYQEQFEPVSNGDLVEILGVPADFSRVNVGTKAQEDEENDINEVTMAIFDKSQNLAGSVVNLSGNTSFTIDKTNRQIVLPNGQTISLGAGDLTECTICMVANSWSKLQSVVTTKGADLKISDMEGVQMDVVGIDVPELGFPMIGKEEKVNLSSTGASDMLPIRLNKLYAKVNVIVQVSATQVVETPSFKMDNWSVHNIPTKVALGDPSDQTICAENSSMVTSTQTITSPTEGLPLISNSDLEDPETFTLTFYLPEHVVIPQYTADTYPFPTGLPESEYQRYKPKMFGDRKYPTYVQINGSYSDHRGQVSSVVYQLYLGQDNTDDFRILRNQELNNKVVIKGITDNKEAADNNVDGVDNVSVDHRVSITSTGYSIAIERESLLDSHFEYRPIDITVQKGSKVSIEVEDPDECKWLRFDLTEQIRDYFTTNLVTETLKDNTFYELDNTTGTSEKNQRIWVYIDENDNYYDDLLDKDTTDPEEMKHIVPYREHDLIIKYYESADDNNPKTHYYTFRQNNLWRVWGGAGTGDNADKNRYYDIENHEEYLYNYASDDTWDSITDGMAWGLMSDITLGEQAVLGVALSDTLKSVTLDTGIDYSNTILDASKPFYDFYISSGESNGSTYRSYNGKTFSNEIMEKLLFESLYTYENGQTYRTGENSSAQGVSVSISKSTVVSDGKLVSTPKSAVEYCYHKNRRDVNGNIITKSGDTYNRSAVKWFLPSIDQIEEIVKGGYHQFDEFKSKWYWSSQPAYDRYYFTYSGTFGWTSDDGYLYLDDLTNARATKVTPDDYGEFSDPEPSGSENVSSTLVGTHNWTATLAILGGGVDHKYTSNASYSVGDLDPGNQHRSSINRVRCVYRTGYGTKPSE